MLINPVQVACPLRTQVGNGAFWLKLPQNTQKSGGKRRFRWEWHIFKNINVYLSSQIDKLLNNQRL